MGIFDFLKREKKEKTSDLKKTIKAAKEISEMHKKRFRATEYIMCKNGKMLESNFGQHYTKPPNKWFKEWQSEKRKNLRNKWYVGYNILIRTDDISSIVMVIKEIKDD